MNALGLGESLHLDVRAARSWNRQSNGAKVVDLLIRRASSILELFW